jgi:hypothetical protein
MHFIPKNLILCTELNRERVERQIQAHILFLLGLDTSGKDSALQFFDFYSEELGVILNKLP